MSTREELEAKLDKSMNFNGMMKGMMDTRNSMINVEMVGGTPITVNSSTIAMLRDEFIAKLRVELPDEGFSAYVNAMTNYSPNIITSLEHIDAVIQAQTEADQYVPM